MIDIRKKIVTLISLLMLIIMLGAGGYVFIEGWTLTDALFMTVITMSTVGYGAVGELSAAGKIFTMFLNIGGIALYSYSFFSLVSIVSTGSIQKLFRRSQMDRTIDKIQGHYIICGTGEIARHITRELGAVSKSFIVVDSSEAEIIRAKLEEGLYIVGEPDTEDTLRAAGIERAAGIFCTLHDDRSNILLTLAARDLSKTVRIVALSRSEESYTKFIKAGADRVIFSYRIGGMRMASEMLRPGVVTFLDRMLKEAGGTRFEEVPISGESPLAGRPLNTAGFQEKYELSVVAVQRPDGSYDYNTLSENARNIEVGDALVVIGKASEIEKFRKYASP